MTSTADTTQHPDVSEIADLAEGLLSPAQSAEVRQHLDGCPLCTDVHASLEEIRGLLGTFPGAMTMPADVAGRIDAALAAEAPPESTAPEPGPHVSRETSPASPQPEVKSGDRPAGHARGTTGPGRSRSSRRRRRTAVLGALVGVAAVGMTVLVIQTSTMSKGTSHKEASVSTSASDTREFSASNLRNRVQTLVSGTPASEQAETKIDRGRPLRDEDGGESPSRAPETPEVQRTPGIPPCVQLGTGRTDAPIAVEQGTYDGVSAYLVVLPDVVDLQQVQAYVIEADCVNNAPSSAGKVLLTDTFPRL
ncbi:anti-sigma factor family protein [Streptomyces sp. NPDC004726]